MGISIIIRLSFVLQPGDLLHELAEDRLKCGGFHHSFQGGLVIGEFLAGIAPLNFVSGWVVAFRNTPQPALTTTGRAHCFDDFTHDFPPFLCRTGTGKIAPDPSLHVAAVFIALTQEGVVVDFHRAFDFALFPGQFDDFTPPLFSLRVTVFTEAAVR